MYHYYIVVTFLTLTLVDISPSLQLTKAEDALPAGNIAFPVGQHIAAPLGRQHHSHAVGEHLGYRVNEVLCSCRDFLFQTPKPCLKQNGGNACAVKD